MSLRYSIFTLLLLFIVILLGVENYEVWNHPSEVILEDGATRKQEKTPEPAATISGSQIGTNSTAPYVFIAGKNIFNPERKDFPVVPLNPSSKTNGRPQVILYGVTLAGDYQSAFVANPETSLKMGKKEQMIIKLGERIGQYKLAKVLSDRITLEASGDTFEVLLHDPKMPKKRTGIRTETKPAMITSTVASSTPTGEVKREVMSAQEAARSPSRPTRTEAPRTTATRERSEEPKEPSPVPMQPQPVTTPPPLMPPAAPPPMPAPMTPTTITPNMVPRSVPVPPGMGTPVQPLSTTR